MHVDPRKKPSKIITTSLQWADHRSKMLTSATIRNISTPYCVSDGNYTDPSAFSPGISKSNIKRENYGMSDPGATSNHESRTENDKTLLVKRPVLAALNSAQRPREREDSNESDDEMPDPR